MSLLSRSEGVLFTVSLAIQLEVVVPKGFVAILC